MIAEGEKTRYSPRTARTFDTLWKANVRLSDEVLLYYRHRQLRNDGVGQGCIRREGEVRRKIERPIVWFILALLVPSSTNCRITRVSDFPFALREDMAK